MKKNLILTLALLIVALPLAAKTTLRSPDKQYVVTIDLNDAGEPFYSVKFAGKQIVLDSKLGFDVAGKAWCTGLSIDDTKTRSVDSSWEQPYGERKTVIDKYNEVVLELEGEGKELNLVFRAYNEGVAYKYEFPESCGDMTLSAEKSTFAMPEGTTAYHNIAEEPYFVMPLDSMTKEAGRPLTMQLKNEIWVSLGDANMVDYARARFVLDPSSKSTVVTNLASEVEFTAPYSTPWRLIMAGKQAIDLINNNHIYLNVSEPCKIEDTSWIKPGKVFRTGLSHEQGILGADFAADRGLQYVHFDAGWYGPERADASDARMVHPTLDLNLKEVCEYAAEKGIGVLVYVNQKHLHRQMDEFLPIYKEWGIKGIKYGFVNTGNQEDTKWLHEAVAKCAEYEMLVDIHDAYRPSGVSRTYPNLLTQEGIRGNEQMPESVDNVMHPFSRYLSGAGDYTPCYFSSRVKNTHGHQLAMIAVYYSPFQFLFWYDKTDVYRGEEELEFWANAPTVWDDSKALAGEPGKNILMARRSGEEWFVGAMTSAASTMVVETAKFLEKGEEYSVTLYQDNPDLGTRTNVEITNRMIKGGDKIELNMIDNGGASLHIVPVKK